MLDRSVDSASPTKLDVAANVIKGVVACGMTATLVQDVRFASILKGFSTNDTSEVLNAFCLLNSSGGTRLSIFLGTALFGGIAGMAITYRQSIKAGFVNFGLWSGAINSPVALTVAQSLDNEPENFPHERTPLRQN